MKSSFVMITYILCNIPSYYFTARSLSVIAWQTLLDISIVLNLNILLSYGELKTLYLS